MESTSTFMLVTMPASSSMPLMACASLSASACFSLISASISAISAASSSTRPIAVVFLSSATGSCFSFSIHGPSAVIALSTCACSSDTLAYRSRSRSASVPFNLASASLFSAPSIFDCKCCISAFNRAILPSRWLMASSFAM